MTAELDLIKQRVESYKKPLPAVDQYPILHDEISDYLNEINQNNAPENGIFRLSKRVVLKEQQRPRFTLRNLRVGITALAVSALVFASIAIEQKPIFGQNNQDPQQKITELVLENLGANCEAVEVPELRMMCEGKVAHRNTQIALLRMPTPTPTLTPRPTDYVRPLPAVYMNHIR